jgi:dinuclear metal center YbgI/SA1388 family protein
VIAPAVRDLLDTLEVHIPAQWAEPWDRVGLLVGDHAAECRRVYVSLDPTRSALARAVTAGANVLLTHHPAYLEPPPLVSSPGMSGVAFEAARSGVALVAAHTNLDRSPDGANALAVALGLVPGTPLERSLQPVEIVSVYVPADAEGAVRAAAEAAGAGRIGRYAECSFSSPGVGRHLALQGAQPRTGHVGGPAEAPETRLELVCASGAGARVAAAVRSVHPYDEPVIVVGEGQLSRGAARMGRLCEMQAPVALEEVARRVGRSLGVTPTVWGERAGPVHRVALAPGSGRSLVGDAVAAGADAFVTGELRYHEALDAVEAGLAIIEAGHDATELPMVGVLAEIAGRTHGLTPQDVIVDDARAHWWTPGDA